MLIKILKKLFCRDEKKLCKIVQKYSTISFDIFDTLIIRECVLPTEIFNLVEKRFNQQYNDKIAGFYKKRIIAEKEARKISTKEEVTIDDIYSNLSKIYDSNKCNKLKNIEIEIEIEQCKARENILEIYNKCLINGKTIFITSDMYLPESVILLILRKNKIPFPHKLYLSNKENKTKRNGSLFKLLLEENKQNPNQILHIGDNFRSDFVKPRELGINAFWIKKE